MRRPWDISGALRGCGQVCSVANGATQCLSGFCAFRGCDEGFEDADGDLSNGCENAVGDPPRMIGSPDDRRSQTGSQSLWAMIFVLFLCRK